MKWVFRYFFKPIINFSAILIAAIIGIMILFFAILYDFRVKYWAKKYVQVLTEFWFEFITLNVEDPESERMPE